MPLSPGSPPSTTVGRLPDEFLGAPNGHEGSHHFLVDDFVTAVNDGTLPPVNAWVAARFTLPGIVAHASALRRTANACPSAISATLRRS